MELIRERLFSPLRGAFQNKSAYTGTSGGRCAGNRDNLTF